MRSFLFILPLGFCLTEVIAPSLFLPFLVPERNDGTLPGIKLQYSTYTMPNYNDQELFACSTIVCGLSLCEGRV